MGGGGEMSRRQKQPTTNVTLDLPLRFEGKSPYGCPLSIILMLIRANPLGSVTQGTPLTPPWTRIHDGLTAALSATYNPTL